MSQQEDMMGDKNKILEVQWKALKTESKDYAGKQKYSLEEMEMWSKIKMTREKNNGKNLQSVNAFHGARSSTANEKYSNKKLKRRRVVKFLRKM